jgi:hypothetical protein
VLFEDREQGGMGLPMGVGKDGYKAVLGISKLDPSLNVPPNHG